MASLTLSGILLFSAASCSTATKTAANLALGAITKADSGLSANLQAGKVNSQSLGKTNISEQSISLPVSRDSAIRQSADENKVSANNIEKVVVNELQAWVFLVAIIGWMLPTPGEIARRAREYLKKSKRCTISRKRTNRKLIEWISGDTSSSGSESLP